MKKTKNDLKDEALLFITMNIHVTLYSLHGAKTEEECKEVLNIYRDRIENLGVEIYKKQLNVIQGIANDIEQIKQLAKDMNEFHVFEENIKAIMFSGRVTMQDIVKMYNDKFKPQNGSFQLDNIGNIVFRENLGCGDYKPNWL